MEALLLVARLLLALVFGFAGAGKLADEEGSRDALKGFGVPESLIAPLAWLLPWVELATAVSLLPLATAWFGGWAALALLLAFSTGIAVNLVKGNAPDCHCFGQLHSEPVSWKVFARNLALAAVAALIVTKGAGTSAFSWLGELRPVEAIVLTMSLITISIVLATLNAVRHLSEDVAGMKKLIEEDYAAPETVEREEAAPPATGLPVGAPAPAFALATFAGGQTSLNDLLAQGKAVLLLFVSPNCGPCKVLLPLVRTWQRDYGDQLTIAVISRGTPEEVKGKLDKYEISHVLLQGDHTTNVDYLAPWTPAAVLINRQGRLAHNVATGDAAIRALVNYAVSSSESGSENAAPIKLGSSLFNIGETAPRFSLPNLQGEEVALHSLLKGQTLLLFWNPGCGFCQRMVGELKHWEAKPKLPEALSSDTQLLFVSTGERDEIEVGSAGFRAPFLHDADNDIAPLFGADGTPSGLLLDAQGRIASSLAVGERNLLALLGLRKVELPLAKGA